ncbi:hypothetical protein IAT38_003627 [Cryptococcus sp. DSM 104549]
MISRVLVASIAWLGLVAAAPLEQRSVSVLSQAQISAFTNPAQYASALTKPDTIVTGGDGGSTPSYFIATTNGETVVAIAGTNVANGFSIAVDVDFPLVSVNTSRFPGGSGLKAHQGFNGAFERMADPILAAVKAAGSSKVLVTGHSLGGALTLLTSTFLQKALGSGVTVTAKAFAAPRVGNQAWANYVDATLGSNQQHLVNFNDDVPHVPPREWGFRQSSNEIWIHADGTTYTACSGQENSFLSGPRRSLLTCVSALKQCSDSLETPFGEIALVASFVSSLDLVAHLGPYAGVTITSTTCTEVYL